MTSTTPRRWTAVDHGMLHLVRLVLDDAWHPMYAAANLRRLIADQRVLQQMAARVGRALADRPSPVGERAARTLAVAVAIGDPSREHDLTAELRASGAIRG